MLTTLAAVCAVAAAVYSTWSPCGHSMLSQITPVGERARGHRYAVTAGWYIVGAVAGGMTFGALMAALAVGISEVGLTATTALGVAAVLAVVGGVLDAHPLRIGPPFYRRQVNEDWLTRYRGWLYGLGYGWQVGAGITTYIMTTAVLLTVALAALTADPLTAFVVGVAFGSVRALAVLLTARAHDLPSLFALHRRFDAWGPSVRRSVIAIQFAIGAAAAWDAWSPLAALAIVVIGVVALIRPAQVAADGPQPHPSVAPS